jgi:hypothetical protein
MQQIPFFVDMVKANPLDAMVEIRAVAELVETIKPPLDYVTNNTYYL